MFAIAQSQRSLIPGEVVKFHDDFLFYDGINLNYIPLDKQNKILLLSYCSKNGNGLKTIYPSELFLDKNIYTINLTKEQEKSIKHYSLYDMQINDDINFDPKSYDETVNLLEKVKEEFYKESMIPSIEDNDEHFGLL